jgi:hypothetical protein
MTRPLIRRPCYCRGAGRRPQRRCRYCGGSGWRPILGVEAAEALAEVLSLPLADLPTALLQARHNSAKLQATAIAEGRDRLADVLGNEALLLEGVAERLWQLLAQEGLLKGGGGVVTWPPPQAPRRRRPFSQVRCMERQR